MQIIRKVISLAHDYEALQGKLKQYDSETDAKIAKYKKEISILDRKISTSAKEHREKEMSLRQRLHRAKEELESELKAKKAAEKEHVAMEEELTSLRRKAGLYQKKVRYLCVLPLNKRHANFIIYAVPFSETRPRRTSKVNRNQV